MPLAREFQSALSFLGGFSSFSDCPEFEFEQCWYRFFRFENDDRDPWGRSAELAHGNFGAHATNFSQGVSSLLAAHAGLAPHGVTFLPDVPEHSQGSGRPRHTISVDFPERFDVAISFAGPEREHAEMLANTVRDAGFEVFYDGYYPEQLWGKDLVSFFDEIYRKRARFCVMFVSQSYASRMWTIHERRSAQARALEERGGEYILPIQVDDTELDGLQPTIGYVSLRQQNAGEIAQLLIQKLNVDGT